MLGDSPATIEQQPTQSSQAPRKKRARVDATVESVGGIPFFYYLHYQRWKEVLFSPVRLFVCVQDISKSCGRIWRNLSGQVGCLTTINEFDFGEDPNPDLDTRQNYLVFKVIFHH